ncbi:Protein of unknown function (DUF3631) [Promicromonospora umidemergens]|nr:DUF3631 domain-containing protein [Promicromonospora umidemergens]MCP2286831.1 Protein of unknown function (DUF3631) [Promicromonospora umidemergens]
MTTPTTAAPMSGGTADSGASTPAEAATTEPSPALDGAVVLDQVQAAVRKYVILPSPEAMTAVVLWAAASHVVPFLGSAPRLVIRGPERRCGKSRLLDMLEALCWQAFMGVNVSHAALSRTVHFAGNEPPTIMIDEADAMFGPKAGSDNEDIRGILNAGFQPGRTVPRYDAGRQEVEHLRTFAMAALAGIGAMPDTIEDRAVVVKMRRRAKGEKVAPYRMTRDRADLITLSGVLHKWARSQRVTIGTPVVSMPVEDRAADTWEPLVAVADAAGGDWPRLARHAAVVMNQEKEESIELSVQTRLLIDTRAAFESDDALPTHTLLERLKADEEAPWATFGPTGLTPRRLGLLLREFDITSRNVRLKKSDGSDYQVKGFRREDFEDSWARYCPADEVEDDAGTAGGQGFAAMTRPNPSQPDETAGQAPLFTAEP